MSTLVRPGPSALTGARGAVRDTVLVFTRELKPLLRDPFSVVFSMVQPLFFLALFAPLLTSVGGVGGGSGDSALQWFVPGIVVMSCLFGASMTGSNLLMEMKTGSHERTLVTPLSYALALATRGQDWIFWTVQQTFLFPVLLLAGMLLPVDAGPGWLRGLSRANPLTYIVDAMRGLFTGSFDPGRAAVGLNS
jgi:ABC-2 type transport system permease protein